MINKRSVIYVVAMLAVLGMVSGPAVAGQGCKNVNTNIKALSEFWEDPAICNGYDFCQYVEIKGTLNGIWWVYGYYEDVEPVAGGEGIVYRLTSVIETNQGVLYADDMEISNFNAPDGLAVHDAVDGGTGRYEGASGWLAGWLSFIEPVRGKIAGEICWNGD